MVIAVAAFLRSSSRIAASSDEDRAAVRALLNNGGGDSLGYFATRDDRAYVFSPSRKAAVAYTVVSGVCLAAGDPIGDVEAWPSAIDAWLRRSEERAWAPAVLAASETGAEIYGRVGFDALEIGDEAVIEVADFTLEGRAMRTVRQAVTRARRRGYAVTVRRVAQLSRDYVAELRSTSASWHDGRERGFSMALSRFGDDRDPACLIAEAHTAAGRLVAVLQFVPWGRDGLSLDVMRRAPDLDNGVMELMMAEVLDHAQQSGVGRVSINFAMFRSSLARGERIGAGPSTRAWFRALLFFSRWWQIASLYRANAKFRPSWEPRFICFSSSRDLALIAYAALRAEGFLTLAKRESVGTGDGQLDERGGQR